MLASVLTCIIAILIFFKFDSHRFRALYCGIACAVFLPVLTALSYSVNLFLQTVGVEGFVNESFALVGRSFVAPLSQLSGAEVMPAVVFPGWIMVLAVLATAIRLLATARKNHQPS